MKRNLFVLPDGTEIFSGIGETPAIKSVIHTQDVNTATDLDFAAACAAAVEVELIGAEAAFSLPAGTELLYMTVDDNGARTEVGRFLMEAPKKASANVYRFTAYDRMILFDRDMTGWLTSLDQWPYTIRDLLDLCAAECGVEIEEGIELVNGDYPVQKFIREITGRQLIQWVAGANAAFATMTPKGKLTFAGYVDGGRLDLPRKSMVVTDYATSPIQRVVVRQAEDDVGVSWPENSDGETYSVTDNPLLATFTTEALLPYVERLADRVIGLSYTPVTTEVWDEKLFCRPGVFYTIERNGIEYKTAVFSVKRKGSMATVKSTGNASRNSASAVNGKNVVEIIQGRMARINVSIEEVSSSLSQQKIDLEGVTEQTTTVVQTAAGLEVTVTEVKKDLGNKADRAEVAELSEHFLFTEEGMTIFNDATGMGINVSEQQVAFTGGQDPTTVITPNQMNTTKLVVGERMDIGEFSFLPRTNGNLSFRYIGE